MYRPLTIAQQNIWNLQKFYEGTSISNICGSVLYTEKLDRAILAQAVNQMVACQSGLRLQFYEQEGQVVQNIAPHEAFSVPYKVFDSDTAFQEYAEECAKRPFDLYDAVMYQFTIFELKGQTGILLCASHLVSDAWSMSLAATQAYQFYQEILSDSRINHTENDFSDIISAEQSYFSSPKYQKDVAYWESRYTQNPEHSPIKLYSGQTTIPEAKRYIRVLSQEQISEISEFCHVSGYTPAVVFEAAMISYLTKINPENRTITIGVPILNRPNSRAKNTIGMFISTMPLTVEVSENMTFAELCNSITTAHAQLFRHQKYPYSEILRSLHEKNNFTGNLYDVMVSFQNAKISVPGYTQWFSNGYSEAPFILNIDNRDNGSSYIWTIDYQTEVFHQESEIQLIIDRLEYILRQILSNYKIPLSEISIIPDAEYQRMIFDFNDTTAEYPKDKCIHELFCEQAARTPDNPALMFEDQVFTYKQLDAMSNSLANALREMGIGQNDIVPIISNRSWHIIMAIFGIFKAGGAYMPVDPDYPEDRIKYMLSEATPKVVLKYGINLSITEKTIDLETFDFYSKVDPIDNINSVRDCFGIIFTSGSTGQPKGSILCHQGAVNFAYANDVKYTECSSFLSASTMTFDAFFVETICPIIRGIPCVLASSAEQFEPDSFSALIGKHINLNTFSTPTKFLQLISDSPNKSFLRNFKCISVGGEVFSNELYDVLSEHNDCVKIINVYGPTEATIEVSQKHIKSQNDTTIGRPIANTKIYILDHDCKPLPIGIAGEMCVSGDGVGKGYLNRPELTAEKFIQNPFIPGKSMYRTGDLARWRADGEIEFLGRIDTQVKIRGLRIELGEIESVMAQFPGISIAAAADKRDKDDRQYLVGYYTAKTVIDETALRRHLSAKLPKYMVPNYFVQLETLPMTPSGKIDRKNLPLLHFTAQAMEYVPPETETEKQLNDIWCELLHVERVGKTNDFFELGGDSLMVISVLSKVKSTFQVELSIRDIMENPVLERLADVIDRMERVGTVITPGHRSKYILLPQQKAIYAACQKNPRSLAYNMPVRVRLSDRVDHNKLTHCLEEIVSRHDSLKTRIISKDNEIYGLCDESAHLIVESYSNEDCSAFLRPFALETAPLVRVGFTEDFLLFDMHHIIADGESLNIILQEIVTMYGSGEAVLSDVTYADYADYFQRTDFFAHREYFKNMLHCDFEPVELPKRRDGRGTGGASLLFHLPADTAERGRQFAKANGLTDTMLFLGAYGILLSKYTGRTDILSSVTLSNRTHSETAIVVGMFVNTLPIYLPVEGDVKGYFVKIKDLILSLFQYQELPFLEIADAVGMTDKTVVNTAFVYQADGDKRLKLDGETFIPELLDTKSSKFDLLFEITPAGNGCTVRMEYDCEKYDEKLIESLFAAYGKILVQLSAEKISDISVLSEAEYQKVVYDFNNTAVDYPCDECVYELFEQQAKRTPDKTALIFEGKSYTYRQLDELSNGLAVSMRGLGIRQGDTVAVLLNRDEKVVLAQLAVLKIGAVFIPIDSRYPEDRIKYILSESGVKVILKNADIRLAIPQTRNIEDLDMTPTASVEHPLVDAGDTCYIIFTSGSTGKPKGCTLTNRGLVNFCRNNNILTTCNKLNRQVCISVNTISFDYFIAESLLPLANGYTIVLASEEESVNQEQFVKLATSTQANIIQTTPTRFKLYFDEKRDLSYLRQFDVIVTSGEALLVELLNTFRQNSGAKIFNPLGPSECSVWIAGGELRLTDGEVTAGDITIGKPIANTQIYILDRNHNPMPVGVAGELCISGDGVGNGYLNHPELTAERFIPNPFITGKTMYCTGDLARWNEHGEIEYLGRIDTQVKIRGLRIELGEIESVMSQFPGISLVAAADRRDMTGRQFLVGYYTTDDSVDEAALRQYLSAKLPKYMVPNYFLCLEKLPMTPSGKIDRKNLPSPDFSAWVEEYVPPRNDEERILCEIISEILHYEQVGIRDDFFELGGDSLKAIEFVTKAHGAGIYFALQNVFDYSTVEGLCGFLQKKPEQGGIFSPEQFVKYVPILERNVWDAEFALKRYKLGTVLLTGGTGFLGAHILDALMKHGVQKIYCLVRGGEERLAKRLQYYFGEQYAASIGGTIIPIVGDLESETIGDGLPDQVDYIIHSAASVKHYGSWQYFKRANVDATGRIVSYARRINARLIYISTTSVSGNSMADQFDGYVSEEEKHFYESSLYIGQPLDNVYARSKFEAETLVLDAMWEGLQANIIRMGNLTNRVTDLKFQPNYMENAFLKRIKAVLDLSCLPDYLMSIYAEFTPVDSAAEAIVKIAEYMNEKYTVFHVNSNQKLYFDKILEYLNRAGHTLEVISGAEFAKRIRATINSSQRYIFEALSNDLSQDDLLQYDSNIRIENRFTVQYLRSIGFEWPEIDYAYLKGYLDYFERLGYFGGAKHDKKQK